MDVAPDLYELYAEFGMTAEKAQLVEIEAGNVGLTFMTVFFKPDKITPDQREFFRSIIEDTNRQTLGTLLKTVKSIGSYDESILRAVDKALERRNYLVHHFFREHNFAILSETGRKGMIAELRDIRSDLAFGLAMLTAITGTLNQIAGIDGLANEVAEKLLSCGKRVQI